jgi:hypothetical protein
MIPEWVFYPLAMRANSAGRQSTDICGSLDFRHKWRKNAFFSCVGSIEDEHGKTSVLDSMSRVARDVADILRYRWNGSTNLAHVPTKWKGVLSDDTPEECRRG